jgi:DHA3 family multidrug efflux protein-like MFS transporter
MSGIFLVSTAVSGFWFGSLVDHNKKKTVMIISSLVSLVIYIIGFEIYQTAPADAFNHVDSVILWIFVPLLLLGVIAGNIRNIAISTLVTVLVDEKKRDKANGMVGTASGIGFLVTSVISGFLVGHSGMFLVLVLAIVATLLAILHLWLMPIKEKITNISEDTHKNVDIRGTLKAIGAVLVYLR